jgi:signal transduction histidine kinase
VERANAAALAAVQARMEDIAGMPVWDAPWFSGTPGATEQARIAFEAAAAGRDFKTEIDLDLPIGRRTLLFTMRPMRDQSGRVIAVMPEGVDITDRRLAEEALRQSQKLEAMGQLTGGVAHDFNNVLTPIIAGLDLLSRRGLGGPREQRLIAGALQSAERARTLVQRLLAFARRQPLQPVPVDIAALFGNMAELLASTVGPKIQVITDVADGLPPALADTNQLEMALLNLGVNARDAMPDGGTLTLAARRLRIGPRHRSRLPQGHYLLLSVADSGQGMDAKTLAHAVEPFFSTKGIGRGTGLGLSMVHGLASQLGGALTIQSKPGEGTTVELWLPISSESPAEAADRPAAAARGAGLALVVDDEDAVRAATADMLTDLGYDVEEAASAEDALARLDHGLAPALLVTDHLMPGMTGADLVRAWRERRPGAPALIVSGYADAEGVAPDLPRLTKPFRQDELAAAIAEAKL